MPWAISIFLALGIVWACDFFGINRENVLYVNPLAYWGVVPMSIAVASLAVVSFVRKSRTADLGGRWYVLRKTDALRWGACGLLVFAVAGVGAAFLCRYLIQVSLNYATEDAFVVDARISELSHPSSRALGSCRARATVSWGGGASTRVCVERLFVGRQLLDFPLASNTEHAVVLHGRSAWAGAVIDRISERNEQAEEAR